LWHRRVGRLARSNRLRVLLQVVGENAQRDALQLDQVS
jgi:hypothetical protein